MLEAVITGVVAIMVCTINNYYQHKAVKQQHDRTIGLIEYRLEQLHKKVEAHNNLVERMYEIETKAEVYEEKIKVVNHRIEDLENGGRGNEEN